MHPLPTQIATEFIFGRNRGRFEAEDAVILATPSIVTAELVPGFQAPDAVHTIVNAYFRIPLPVDLLPIQGVLNSLTEWLVAYPDRLSVMYREDLVGTIWHEITQLTSLRGGLPPWQIVKEQRATFAATQPDRAISDARIHCWNLVSAGNWPPPAHSLQPQSRVRSAPTQLRQRLWIRRGAGTVLRHA